jgi:hypothetical protein
VVPPVWVNEFIVLLLELSSVNRNRSSSVSSARSE